MFREEVEKHKERHHAPGHDLRQDEPEINQGEA